MRQTAAQKRLAAKVCELGCMACRQDGFHTEPSCHHLKEYGNRNHDRIFGLCPAHHQGDQAVTGVPGRHLNPIEFRERYGTDQALFEECMSLIKN